MFTIPSRSFGCAVLGLLASFVAIIHADELGEFMLAAQENNPAIQAARWRVEQTLLKHEELLEFFDPALYAAVGYADRSRGIPGSSNYSSLTNNSLDLQAGIEAPIIPGAYVSAGIAERSLRDPEGFDDLYQTLFGVRVRVPLLRDRVFRTLTLSRSMAAMEYNIAVSRLLSSSQDLRQEVELAYITAYESLASYQVTRQASDRFQNLYEEAQELSRLQVVPQYQTYQSQLELQIGREDEEKARNRHELNLVTLAGSIGHGQAIVLTADPGALFQQAIVQQQLPELKQERVLRQRGDYLETANAIEYAKIQHASAKEESRDDLSLNMGVNWQGENKNWPYGNHDLLTDRHVGGEITLVWKRSLDYRGPKNRMARHRARIEELKADMERIELNIHVELQRAILNYESARQRLELVNHGIAAARETVAAELERFRLGESTSSNVTDAQKNLTAILQRQNTAAADLLRAKANFHHAIGYQLDND
jgi:outer membrane protein TolC